MNIMVDLYILWMMIIISVDVKLPFDIYFYLARETDGSQKFCPYTNVSNCCHVGRFFTAFLAFSFERKTRFHNRRPTWQH